MFKPLITMKSGTFELMDGEHPCPLCSAPLYRKLETPLGKTQIDCFTCEATATGKDVETAVGVLEMVREDVAASRANALYNAEHPKGDSRNDD